jgi:hypothetical protein
MFLLSIKVKTLSAPTIHLSKNPKGLFHILGETLESIDVGQRCGINHCNKKKPEDDSYECVPLVFLIRSGNLLKSKRLHFLLVFLLRFSVLSLASHFGHKLDLDRCSCQTAILDTTIESIS